MGCENKNGPLGREWIFNGKRNSEQLCEHILFSYIFEIPKRGNVDQ